jgi:hypothetical protein
LLFLFEACFFGFALLLESFAVFWFLGTGESFFLGITVIFLVGFFFSSLAAAVGLFNNSIMNLPSSLLETFIFFTWEKSGRISDCTSFFLVELFV